MRYLLTNTPLANKMIWPVKCNIIPSNSVYICEITGTCFENPLDVVITLQCQHMFWNLAKSKIFRCSFLTWKLIVFIISAIVQFNWLMNALSCQTTVRIGTYTHTHTRTYARTHAHLQRIILIHSVNQDRVIKSQKLCLCQALKNFHEKH